MKRIVLLLIAVIAGIILTATSALADSPNFHFANSSIDTNTGALNVSFKETGLGNTVSTEKVTLTVATATAVYQCFNNGGNHPQAGNKETVSTSLTTSGIFPVRNGQTTGTISAGPPSQNANGPFSCPSGQTLFLQSVSYSGITVTGATGDSLGATPDPISNTTLHIKIG